MQVHICGARGTTPAPGAAFVRYGGHTCCVAVTGAEGGVPDLILDAGTGVREAAPLFGDQPFGGTLLLTHLHWDHIQGLPFFAAADREDACVTVLLPDQGPGSDAGSVLAQVMSPPFFPIGPQGLRGAWSFQGAQPEQWLSGGYTVTARELPHKGGRTFGYRVSDGRSTLAYMPDHCPTAIGPGPDGLGEYHEAALELAADCDLLIHDAHLHGRDELAARGYLGHAAAEYAIALGERAGARRVVLFHHGPERTDEQLEELSRRLPDAPAVTLAVQGEELLP